MTESELYVVKGSRTGRDAVLGYLSLFTSVGTLLCCALPSLLVLLGLGATVASALSFLPWLVTLSHHKRVVFWVAGIMIALSFLYTYWWAPRLQRARTTCEENDPACGTASRLSRAMLWLAAGVYLTGFSVAYILGPILEFMDR